MVENLITLYEDNETEFQTNGLGGLRDATKCTVYEEKNGEFELTLQYPVNGRHFKDLIMRRIIFAKPDPYRSAQPFRIYDISKPIDGIVTVSAHHISYDLSGYPIAPFRSMSLSLVMQELTSQMSRAFNRANHPFTFRLGNKNDVTTAFDLTTPSNARAILGGSEGSILEKYKGEYEWDRYSVILHNKRGSNRGVRIAYGKNLTDLEQQENCENVWTGVYPFWYSEGDEGATLVELSTSDDGKILHCKGEYDHERILVLDLSSDFQDPPSSSDLRDRAQKYIDDNEIGSPKVSLTVSFVNLADAVGMENGHLLEQVMLCDEVMVDFPLMGVSSSSRVIATTYDVLTDKYESVQLGDAKANLASTIAEQQMAAQKQLDEQKSFIQKAVENATKLITGGLGGYVLLHSSDPNSKYPDEILIMDTPDIKTATRVWRWNSGGLGYSKNGYNGPFELAMTMDGSIVASFITSGELNGALIKAGTIVASAIQTGILQDKTGKNYWNLDTGEFHISYSTQVDGPSSSFSLGDTIESKVSSGEFGTYMQQNYNSFVLGFNNSSRIIQFGTDGISFYTGDGSKNNSEKVMTLDENGTQFYRDGVYVGRTGAFQQVGNPSVRAFGFSLASASSSKYIIWAIQRGSSDSYYPVMYYTGSWSTGESTGGGQELSLSTDLNMHNYTLNNFSLGSYQIYGAKPLGNGGYYYYEIPFVTPGGGEGTITVARGVITSATGARSAGEIPPPTVREYAPPLFETAQ